MKIFLICSKAFYGRVKDYKDKLESMGHSVVLPNCYDAPEKYKKAAAKANHLDDYADAVACLFHECPFKANPSFVPNRL